MVAKDFNDITYLCVSACDVYHSLIHAHIAYDRTTFATNNNFATIVGESSIESIGISYRYNRNLSRCF